MFLLWGLAYFVCDALLVASLITLLCRTDRTVPQPLEYFFPVKGRWLWMLLVTLNAALLLNLGWLLWQFARHIH
jgi:hypothetical protein